MLLPDVMTTAVVIVLGIALNMLPIILPKKVSAAAEIVLSAAILLTLFITLPFGQASFLMALGANAYGSFGQLIDPKKREKRKQLKEIVQDADAERITQVKQTKRIALDLLLTAVVCLGAGIFLVLAPEQYALIKMFILLMFITVIAQTVERIGTFASTGLYWLPKEERLIIVSIFQSREFPLQGLKELRSESAPDLLKLHPLFTFLSANQDYTQSFSRVLRLSFPGEHVYISPQRSEYWENIWSSYAGTDSENSSAQDTKKVLPIWHPRVLKRLFWKGYFAITVKGISAYTGLLLLLIWLEVSAWIIVVFVIAWWALNVYVSDRVLIAATDAEPLNDGKFADRAKAILAKAGIPNTKLFAVDSPIYNGFAAGMNIGRGTIILTTATLQLPVQAVEAILAHEAIHVKKRDVMVNQLIRMLLAAALGGIVFLFFDELRTFTQNYTVLMFIIVYALMYLFTSFLSAASQWMEVRADHLGAELLSGGPSQMSDGLNHLSLAQKQEAEQSLDYSSINDELSKPRFSAVERDPWIWRFLEFQFLTHPPMYWRIQSLERCSSWKQAKIRWMIDRITESLPDIFRNKVH